MGVKHIALPDGQPPTVAFTVVAQLCGHKANETEMGTTIFTENSEGMSFHFDLASQYSFWSTEKLCLA